MFPILHVQLAPVHVADKHKTCVVCGKPDCDFEIELPKTPGYERSAYLAIHVKLGCADKLGKSTDDQGNTFIGQTKSPFNGRSKRQ